MHEKPLEVDVGWVERMKTLLRQEWFWVQSGWAELAQRTASSYQRFAGGKRA